MTAVAGRAAEWQWSVPVKLAEVNGGVLGFTPIPPGTKFPVTVKVIAWQYGHSSEPRLQSAEPVDRTFFFFEVKI